jgi:Protein of unknown function (DUF5131)/ParB-like nuclease domain
MDIPSISQPDLVVNERVRTSKKTCSSPSPAPSHTPPSNDGNGAIKLGQHDIHPVAAAFPAMEDDRFAELVVSIRAHGLRQPIVLAPDGRIVDGINRYRACLKADVVPMFRTLDSGYDELAIIEFIKDVNLNRRDLTTGQRAMIVVNTIAPALKEAAKLRQREHGSTAPGKRARTLVTNSSQVNGERTPTSRKQEAEQGQVSEDSIAKAHRIAEHPDLKAKVMASEMSLHAADKEVARRRADAHDHHPTPEETFDRVNKSSSALAHRVWDPVTIAADSAPEFHRERLVAPVNALRDQMKLGGGRSNGVRLDHSRQRVLVCQSIDLYGTDIPDEWISRVHEACAAYPQWQYVIKTKFPQRYLDRSDLPPSGWLGAIIQRQEDVGPAQDVFRQLHNVRVRWVYLQPLEDLHFSDLTMFDWVVVDAASGNTVEFAWAARLYVQAKEAGCAVFLMSSLMGNTDRERPGMVLPQEVPEGVEVPEKA